MTRLEEKQRGICIGDRFSYEGRKVIVVGFHEIYVLIQDSEKNIHLVLAEELGE